MGDLVNVGRGVAGRWDQGARGLTERGLLSPLAPAAFQGTKAIRGLYQLTHWLGILHLFARTLASFVLPGQQSHLSFASRCAGKRQALESYCSHPCLLAT